MKPSDLLVALFGIGGGIWAGASLGDIPGAVVGGVVGTAATAAVVMLGIRPGVAVPVLIGTLAGGLLGRSIVRTLCFPGSCHAAEVLAAIVTGVGALVGVGLVVALVTRSFDEYRREHGTGAVDPPEPGSS